MQWTGEMNRQSYLEIEKGRKITSMPSYTHFDMYTSKKYNGLLPFISWDQTFSLSPKPHPRI